MKDGDLHGYNVLKSFFSSRASKWSILPPEDSVWTDVRMITPNGQTVYVKAETKYSHYNDKYLSQGVHFPWRKIKHAFEIRKYEPGSFLMAMTNKEGDDLILVRGEYFYLAYQIWPETAGYRAIKPSNGFVLPPHGCFPIVKSTIREDAETFCSVDYGRVTRYHLDGTWKLTKPSDGKFLSGN